MEIELVIVRILCEQGDRGCHLQKAVTQKLKTFVIIPHASLGVNLQVSMLLSVIRIFRQGFECVLKRDPKMQNFAGIKSD